ncbi:MAG TPA: SDR family NAD(P)-dependent oxidoreductase [Rhizomicrobium sp.]|jgi:NAD(P)-dependent dehydrogenase (short-subunit alcohol dehydrogenase family)
MSLAGKACIVTGGAGALGLAVCKALSGAGAKVIAIDHGIVPAEQPGMGGVDLSDASKAKAAINKAVAEMGGLYALINVAGGFKFEKLAEGKIDTWDFLYTINLKTTVNACQAALPHLLKSKNGRIVNIGAAAAAKSASAGMGPYTASKAGVLKLTEALADEVKNDGITVNAISPTTIDTAANRKDMPKADFSKWVQPEEIASLIEYLLSEKASAITGANIPIAGRV